MASCFVDATDAHAHAPTLPPGIYHLTGTIRDATKNTLTWRTTRGTLEVRVTPQSILERDGEHITAQALQKGQLLDGLVRVNDAGKMTALALTARAVKKNTASGGTENSPNPEADTGDWSAPFGIAAGANAPQTPLLAAESASGRAAVWYADAPLPGFYVSVHIAEADTWSPPQFLDFTSAADGQPGIALDYQRQLHLVWEHADQNGIQIRYAAATLDPVNLTFTWNEPVTLSDDRTAAVNPAIAVSDWNAQPRVHVVWLEAQAADANSPTWNIVSRHADSPANAWSAPFSFGVAPSSFARPALAATYGKVAVTDPNGHSTSYDFDSAGNRVSVTDARNHTTTYGYDVENRLTSITVGGNTTTYLYDGDGNRVKKVAGGVATFYIGNYYEVTNNVATKYYYFGKQRVAVRTSAGVTYIHGDHLGSTSATSGASVSAQTYYAYGNIRNTTGTVPTDFGFTGQRRDASAGLMYYGARYYDATLGRFVSADTMVPQAGNPQALNRYAYTLNNPLKYVDPSGHDFVIVGGGAGEDLSFWEGWIRAYRGWGYDDAGDRAWNDFYSGWQGQSSYDARAEFLARRQIQFMNWSAVNPSDPDDAAKHGDLDQISAVLDSQLKGKQGSSLNKVQEI